jgi:hypothetical protein
VRCQRRPVEVDQLIKQLPAGRRIGVAPDSAYSQAADLGPGVPWYAILGVGAATLTILAAVAAPLDDRAGQRSRWLYLAAVLALLHSLVTLEAAPTLRR